MGRYHWIPQFLFQHSRLQAPLHSEVPRAIEIGALLYHRSVSILFKDLHITTFPVSLEGGRFKGTC